MHGIVVYTPVPEVSMFDLTICIEKEAEHIYRDICLEMKKQAEGRLKNVMKYVMKMGDETRFVQTLALRILEVSI